MTHSATVPNDVSAILATAPVWLASPLLLWVPSPRSPSMAIGTARTPTTR